jgi:hypothetical protein
VGNSTGEDMDGTGSVDKRVRNIVCDDWFHRSYFYMMVTLAQDELGQSPPLLRNPILVK